MRVAVTVSIVLAAVFCLSAKIDVFFSPQDKPTKKLIEVLDGASRRVFAAIYTLTDKKIVDALVLAKNRGVDVQLVLDRFSLETPWSKAEVLHDAGIRIFLRSTQVPKIEAPMPYEAKETIAKLDPNFDGFDAEAIEALQPEPENGGKKQRNFNRDALMHNKYAVIDDQLWTGSFNWTVAANTRNQENALLISGEAELISKYLKNFEELVANSSQLDKPAIQQMRREVHRSFKVKGPKPAAPMPPPPEIPTVN